MSKQYTSNSVIQSTETIFANSKKGKSMWCKYLEPDTYGNYGVDVYFNDADTQELITILEAQRDEALEEVKGAGKVIKGVADVFKEKDGKKYFTFKVSSDKQNGPIPIYNVYGKEDKTFKELIGNGSIIKVRYMAKPYYMASTKFVGVSLRLLMIQVIDLKEMTVGGGAFDDETDSIPQSSNQGSFNSFSDVSEDEDF